MSDNEQVNIAFDVAVEKLSKPQGLEAFTIANEKILIYKCYLFEIFPQ